MSQIVEGDKFIPLVDIDFFVSVLYFLFSFYVRHVFQRISLYTTGNGGILGIHFVKKT